MGCSAVVKRLWVERTHTALRVRIGECPPGVLTVVSPDLSSTKMPRTEAQTVLWTRATELPQITQN